MKRLAYMIALMALFFAGCEKQNEDDIPDKPQEVPDKPQEIPAPIPIASYTYDGTEYPVHTALYINDGNNILITISPLQPGEKMSTYALIGINAALEGYEIDTETAWSNDDYYFRYEDPIKYYSEYRKLKEGTICIKRLGGSEDTFDIKADVTLPDGVDFRFEYHGKIASATL